MENTGKNRGLSESQQKYLKYVIEKARLLRNFPSPYNGFDCDEALRQLQDFRRQVEKDPQCTQQCLEELGMAENELRNASHSVDSAMAHIREMSSRSYPCPPQIRDRIIESWLSGGC